MILANNDTLLTQCDITNCQAGEADQKSIRHVIHCVKNHYSTVVVSTSDTDVLLLLLSVLPLLKQIPLMYTPNNYCRFVIGNDVHFYNINELCLLFGEETCKSLPFFHAFTGCDTVSSFFNQSKILRLLVSFN